MENENIELKEIRGINLKTILLIVGVVISSTISIIMTINGLRTDLLKIQTTQDKQSEIIDLKLRTLDIRLTSIEIEQKEQNNKIQQNEDRLAEIKNHNER